jgi:hypothetical protein
MRYRYTNSHLRDMWGYDLPPLDSHERKGKMRFKTEGLKDGVERCDLSLVEANICVT